LALQTPRYFDYAASTPVDPIVLESMMPYFSNIYGNAGSSQHYFGWQANEGVELARKEISDYFKVQSSQVVFTSGATESINLAISGYLSNLEPGHLITSAIEHKAVLEVFKHLEMLGWDIRYLMPSEDGIISLEDIQNAIIPGKTRFVSIMWVNNELGVINPIHEIAKLCSEQNIIFHSDATQAIGKLDIHHGPLPDLLSFSGHKIYSPKGIGALVFKKGIRLQPLILGGSQERNLRAGTLAVQQIVALGTSFSRLPFYLSHLDRITSYQKDLELVLNNHFPDQIRINASNSTKVPHLINITLVGIDWEKMFRTMPQIAFSNGSACNAKTHKPSHVLMALGHKESDALSTMRISISHVTKEEDFQFLKKYLIEKLTILFSK